MSKTTDVLFKELKSAIDANELDNALGICNKSTYGCHKLLVIQKESPSILQKKIQPLLLISRSVT
jgi:hypothetical protein